jgi:hypothetical protein
VAMQNFIRQTRPKAVVVDRWTSVLSVSGNSGVKAMLARLVDFLKLQQTIAVFTSLGSEQTMTGKVFPQ